jgi:hypothetical protein
MCGMHFGGASKKFIKTDFSDLRRRVQISSRSKMGMGCVLQETVYYFVT